MQLANDRAALDLLANSLHDTVSAEAYCTSSRHVLAPHAAAALAERHGLAAWAGAPPAADSPRADNAEARDLLQMLLEVYIAGGCV
jgi:hypothetical protein